MGNTELGSSENLYGESGFEIQGLWQLENGYSIARVNRYPEDLYLAQFNEHLLQGYPVLPWRAQLSDEQRSKMERLQSRIKERVRLNLALMHEGKMVGWSYGWQDSVHTGDFYMAGSLVLPDHRRRGFYSTIVRKLLELSQQEGFSAIRSRHICTNNAVLIAKLKLGFTINGFEQDEVMGTLVRVIYHHDPLRRKAALFRAGKIGESEVLTRLST